MQRAFGWLVLVLSPMGLAAACGDSAGPPYEVTGDVVSHETTKDISVWAPVESGGWPVVYALHGIDGNRTDLDLTAAALARQGAVVFAPDYRTDLVSPAAMIEANQDAVCGFRFMRQIADEYGGDLDRPVTLMGFSLGATLVLNGAHAEDQSFGVSCFEEVPRVDVVLAIAGCHYEFEGERFDFGTEGWVDDDVDVVLVAGGEDQVCAAWQSEDAAETMRAAGFDVDLVIVEGADHFALIFHDLVDGEWVEVPDDPIGDQTVEIVLDAIDAASA